MANTKSSIKRVRRNSARAAVNNTRRARVRTFIKRVESAIFSKDFDGAQKALAAAKPEIQRAASKGIVHKNTASRKISRLSAGIKAINK